MPQTDDQLFDEFMDEVENADATRAHLFSVMENELLDRGVCDELEKIRAEVFDGVSESRQRDIEDSVRQELEEMV